MLQVLPFEDAQKECLHLIELFDKEKRIDIDTSFPSDDKRFSTDYLWGEARGQMFGVCVCLNPKGERVVLKAFSCQYNSVWTIDGYVPPLFDVNEYESMVNKNDREIHELTDKIELFKQQNDNTENSEKTVLELSERRKKLSRESMKALFSLYRVHCADGSIKTYNELFGINVMVPTGTGDCCAPKLLNYANKHNLCPVSLAEFYYGATNRSATKNHKSFYPPCDEKCKPLMPFLLGLDIVFRDESIVVVNKQAGLLSVPGRGVDMQDCVVSRLKRLFPNCIEQPSVHRLDMDTSGLLVLSLTEEAHKKLSKQFENGKVNKQYIAILDGVLPAEKGNSGRIELKFRLDVENRPHQVYDEEYGKLGVTLWRRLLSDEVKSFCVFSHSAKRKTTYENKNTAILFTPLTGRTHQLRLHSSSEKGLGVPIKGDRLYGVRHEGERLMLHACYLSFEHPITGEHLEFSSKVTW